MAALYKCCEHCTTDDGGRCDESLNGQPDAHELWCDAADCTVGLEFSGWYDVDGKPSRHDTSA